MLHADRKNHTSRNSESSDGYTLVELTVAVALSAMLLSAAIYLFAQSGSTSRNLAKVQNLQDTANRLLVELRKDVRSATSAEFSSAGIKLLVVKLAEDGPPTTVEVLYHFNSDGISREENSSKKRFSFKSLIDAEDYWSVTTLHRHSADGGVFIQIVVIDRSGNQLLKVDERLLKADKSDPAQLNQ